jgi:hypothetical protein
VDLEAHLAGRVDVGLVDLDLERIEGGRGARREERERGEAGERGERASSRGVQGEPLPEH